MTMQELVPLLIEDGRYFVEGETQVPKFVQVRTHKKKRISKKWLKRYGTKVIYETKRAKKLDVTIDLIIEFCSEKGLPIPDELLANINNEGENKYD
jgi:hypothetical protein